MFGYVDIKVHGGMVAYTRDGMHGLWRLGAFVYRARRLRQRALGISVCVDCWIMGLGSIALVREDGKALVRVWDDGYTLGLFRPGPIG